MSTTAEQQLILELINRARMDPEGEFYELISNGSGVTDSVELALNYFDVDLDLLLVQLQAFSSVAPLAFNDNLAQSALTHTELMVAQDTQSHQLTGEGSIGERIGAAGYENYTALAESIYAYSYDALYAHAGFYIDWGNGTGGMQDPAGHRNTMLSDSYTEVGIAWVEETDSSTSVGPYLTTQHYGTTSDYAAQALGVVFDDLDNDDFYDIGEGVVGIAITFEGADATYVTTSWASGGYQIVLPQGIYTVTFSGDGMNGEISTTFAMGEDNVKIDAQIADATYVIDDDMILSGTTGADDLVGGTGNDEISAGRGNDIVDAGAGADEVWGEGGDDSIYGGDGNDILRGGQDTDTIDGGAGDDLIRGQKHSDIASGGDGNDNIKGGGGNDFLYGDAGHDFLKGGSRADILYGGAGNDELVGNSFDDILDGGEGNDRLVAGGDDDRLIGGMGDDTLKGGSGSDVFIFDTNHGNDVIVDFDANIDRIEFSGALTGNLSVTQIANLASINSSGDLVLSFGTDSEIVFNNFSDSDALAGSIDLF